MGLSEQLRVILQDYMRDYEYRVEIDGVNFAMCESLPAVLQVVSALARGHVRGIQVYTRTHRGWEPLQLTPARS